MKIFYFVVFLSFFLSLLSISSGNFDDLTTEQKQCLDLIKEEHKVVNYNDFLNPIDSVSINDGITWVDFLTWELFTKKSYFNWDKSQISKWDLFKIYDIYGIDLHKSFFYENELNFNSIRFNNKYDFLSCSLTKHKKIIWNITQLKKWDITTVYTSYPFELSITNFEKDWVKWKKVIQKRNFKDRLWKKDIFQIETLYFVPENKKLVNFYDLYLMLEEYASFTSWYKQKIENIPVNFPSLKEIYNKDWIQIKRYFVWNFIMPDPYGINYIFVNWINFFNDYAEFKRHKIFEYLLKNNSPLAKDIYIIENKWNEKTRTYSEPQLDFVWWVQYFLWDVVLEKDMKEKLVSVQPYYTREINYINNTYHKISNIWIDRIIYKDYVFNTIFTEENRASPDKLLASIKSNSVDNNYKALVDDYKSFTSDYDKIKNGSESQKSEFVEQYGAKFWNHDIFKTDSSLKKISTEIWNLKTVNNSSQNYVYLAIIILLILSVWSIILSRKKK